MKREGEEGELCCTAPAERGGSKRYTLIIILTALSFFFFCENAGSRNRTYKIWNLISIHLLFYIRYIIANLV